MNSRDDAFKLSLSKLREDIVRANGLVREANFFAEEMGRSERFSVTLQIPPQNLSPNRKVNYQKICQDITNSFKNFLIFQRGAFVSEPAILVKRPDEASQIWSMEKLNLKLIDMRDLYDDIKSNNTSEIGTSFPDPFCEDSENHHLIGVANVFLNVLFHDVRLDYHTPIISQQGEVAGRLHVEISRVSGCFPHERVAACDTGSDCSDASDEGCGLAIEVCDLNLAL